MKRTTIEQMEAIAWLSQERDTVRMISNGGGDHKLGGDALSFIKAIYSLGATRVFVCNVGRIQADHLREYCAKNGVAGDAIESTEEILVDMPKDATSAGKIIRLFSKEFNEDFESDYEDGYNESETFRWT